MLANQLSLGNQSGPQKAALQQGDFLGLSTLKRIERLCVSLDICHPRPNAKCSCRLHWKDTNSTDKPPSGSSHSRSIFLSITRLWRPLRNDTTHPRNRRASRGLLLKQKHPHVKTRLGKIKVNIFWTCGCWQHVFNLQRKFVGSLSAREPDGPGNW